MQEGSLFSTPSPAFIVCRLFDDGHSDWCEVVSHCSFDLHFSNNEQCWVSFHVFVSHLYVFFGEMLFRSFSHFLTGLFVFLILSCMSGWYNLKFNSLSAVSFAIIFSHSEGCLFTLFVVSFAVQNLLSLIRSHLFIFVFISITPKEISAGWCMFTCYLSKGAGLWAECVEIFGPVNSWAVLSGQAERFGLFRLIYCESASFLLCRSLHGLIQSSVSLF